MSVHFIPDFRNEHLFFLHNNNNLFIEDNLFGIKMLLSIKVLSNNI